MDLLIVGHNVPQVSAWSHLFIFVYSRYHRQTGTFSLKINSSSLPYSQNTIAHLAMEVFSLKLRHPSVKWIWNYALLKTHCMQSLASFIRLHRIFTQWNTWVKLFSQFKHIPITKRKSICEQHKYQQAQSCKSSFLTHFIYSHLTCA